MHEVDGKLVFNWLIATTEHLESCTQIVCTRARDKDVPSPPHSGPIIALGFPRKRVYQSWLRR